MRLSAWSCGVGLLICLVSAVEGQTQARRPGATSPVVSVATPALQVTTQNPREINLGKPATFIISVENASRIPATGVVVSTTIPDHVEVTRSEPAAMKVEGRQHRFQVGDLSPGATRRLTLVVVPRSTVPVKLDTTVFFASSTQSSVVVRKPVLKITAHAPQEAILGEPIKWTVLVTNTGDGPAEGVVVTPTVVAGKFEGNALRKPVNVGVLQAGETKELTFVAAGSSRGEATARFLASNPDGLEAQQASSLKILQAELAVRVAGPQLQPMGRDGLYEVRVTNPGDAPTGSTMVTVHIPEGLEITNAPEHGYNEEARTLRWRITTVRPSDVVPLRFRAETALDGDQVVEVDVRAERVTAASATHITTVLSRPNLIVTVLNSQEMSAVGDPIQFEVRLLNAGSKNATDVRVRVAVPEGLEAVESAEYSLNRGQIEFPPRALASGEKTSISFRAVGRIVGDHRVRVMISSLAMDNELAFEGSAFCYSREEELERAARGRSSRRHAAR